MGEDRRFDQGMASLPLIEESPGHGDVFAGVSRAGCREINDPLGCNTAESDLNTGPGDLLLEKITISHGGDPGQEHFSGGQLGAEIDHWGIDAPRLGRKDVLMQPGGQGEVIDHAPEQGHGGMAVPVDQTGQGELSLSVQDCPRVDGRALLHRSGGDDVASGDGDKAGSDRLVRFRPRQEGAIGDQQVGFHNCLHKRVAIVYHRMHRLGGRDDRDHYTRKAEMSQGTVFAVPDDGRPG